MIRRSFSIASTELSYVQIFPSLLTLLSLAAPSEQFHPLFLDIETTGSDREESSVYLIGLLWPEEDHWEGLQLFAESPQEEPQILREFSDFLTGFSCTVQYYGDRFDQPFLIQRCLHYGLIDPFQNIPSIDLYRKFLPFKSGLGLSNLKQSTVEQLLSYRPRKHPDGRKCITIYQALQRQAKDAYTDALFGHNEEDLCGMAAVFPMVSFFALLYGRVMVKSVRYEESFLEWNLVLPLPLPIPFHMEHSEFTLSIRSGETILKTSLHEDRLRQYHPNYQDYFYLPEEDLVVPKSLGSCLPRSQRCTARPETCYTWISLSEEFLRNFELQDQVVQKNLPIYLSLKQ